MSIKCFENLPEISLQDAEYIKELRQTHTWRAIAHQMNDRLYGDWGSNQLAGMEFCRVASEMLGEDPDSEPWN